MTTITTVKRSVDKLQCWRPVVKSVYFDEVKHHSSQKKKNQLRKQSSGERNV